MTENEVPDFIKRLIELKPDLDNYSRKSFIDHSSRWYYRETLNFIRKRVARDAMILDLGCGYGTFGIDLARRGFTNYHGVDRDPDRIKLAKTLFSAFKLDPENLTCKDLTHLSGKWDVIMSMEVMYALPARTFQDFLNSISDHLNPDGYLIFTHMVSEAEPKPKRTYLNTHTIIEMFKKAELETTALLPRPFPGGSHRNQWWVAQRNLQKKRRLLVTIDGDAFYQHGAEFKEKILDQYPFKFSVSFISGILDEHPKLHDMAVEILSHSEVEPASHSWRHPQDWSKLSDDELRYETVEAIEYLNKFMVEHGIEKTIKTFFWTGDCNPPAQAIALLDEIGVYNFNGLGWSDEPFQTVDGRVWFLQRGFHDRWWKNQGRGEPWGDMAVDFYKLHLDRPVHIYLHFTCTNEERWPSTKRILDWALEQVEDARLQPVFVSRYIEALKSDYDL